jgi:hypothetical protein
MPRTSKSLKQSPDAPSIGEQEPPSALVEAASPPTGGHTIAMDQAHAQAPGPADELAAGLKHLRGLLEEDDIEGARRFVRQLETRWPDSDRVRHLARTLAPPTVRLRPDLPNISRHQEYAWLHQHAHEYPGQWLALLGDQLLAVDRKLRAVVEQMKRHPGSEKALLHFQPGNPD